MSRNYINSNYDIVVVYMQYVKLVAVNKSIQFYKLFNEANIINILPEYEYYEINDYIKNKYDIVSIDDVNIFSSSAILIYDDDEGVNLDRFNNLRFKETLCFKEFCNTGYIINRYRQYFYKQDIYMHIVDSCNWGCKGCTHFAPLVPKHKIYTFEEIKKDIDLIYETVTPKRLKAMRYLGGEPLLNPEIEDIIKYTRYKFPDLQQIEILTNGFMLKKMPQSFYDTCNECDVSIAVSCYNAPNFSYKELYDFVLAKGIELRLAKIEKSLNINLQKTPRTTSNMFFKCGGSDLFVIHNGNVNPCFTAEFGYIFDNYFGYNFSGDEKPFKLEGHDFYEIYDNLWEPREFCKHCFKLYNGTYTEWTRTKRELSEWTCEDFENS